MVTRTRQSARGPRCAQALPASLHRAYYRRRINPRSAQALQIGGVRTACDAGSRWHRYAFTTADDTKTIVVGSGSDAQGSAFYSLSIDGVLRAEVAPVSGLAVGVSYVVCDVVEALGGRVRVSTTTACGTMISLTNPPINLTTPDTAITMSLGAADIGLERITHHPDLRILQAMHVTVAGLEPTVPIARHSVHPST